LFFHFYSLPAGNVLTRDQHMEERPSPVAERQYLALVYYIRHRI
jgi:hypothetical protein